MQKARGSETEQSRAQCLSQWPGRSPSGLSHSSALSEPPEGLPLNRVLKKQRGKEVTGKPITEVSVSMTPSPSCGSNCGNTATF